MHLEELITHYQPNDAAVQLVRSTKIALFVGISGAGKDTIKTEVLKRPGFAEIISNTTRPPRENNGVMERDGVQYHFITDEIAERMLEQSAFFEAKLVHGTVYGTSIAAIKKAGEAGIAVTDLDVQGVAEYKAVSDNVIAVFIVPPSYEEWIRRLKQRYTTDEAFQQEWPKRRASAITELTRALELPYYHCVINDDLSRAVDVSVEIAERPDVFTRKDDEARLVARDLLRRITDYDEE